MTGVMLLPKLGYKKKVKVYVSLSTPSPSLPPSLLPWILLDLQKETML